MASRLEQRYHLRVGYRSNRDALQARADSLQHELDTAIERAEEAETDAHGASQRIKDLERERNKLAKRLSKLDGNKGRLDTVAIAVVLMLVIGVMTAGIVFSVQSADPPAEKIGDVAELEPLALAPQPVRQHTPAQLRGVKAVTLMNALDRTDHIVHSLELDYHGPKKPTFPQSFDMPSWHSGQAFEETYALFAEAKQGPAMPPIDNAASEYVSHLRTFLPLLQKATRYYDHRDYEDDDFELGRALDPKLLAGWKTHKLRSQELREALAPELEILFATDEGRTELNRRVDAAWRSCSYLGLMVLEEQPIDVPLEACDSHRQRLADELISSGDSHMEYFANLLDDIVKNGKKLRRAKTDFDRGLARSSMAQVYSYASNNYRDDWIKRLNRR